MRVLFVTAVMPSHFFVMAPFAWALRAAGHEVCVATQPALVDTVARSGLPVRAVGGGPDFAGRYRDRVAAGPATADGRPGDPKVLFCAVADEMADDLVAFAREWRPDAVVWEPATLAGPLAAAACDVVSLRYLWGPDIVGRGAGRDRLPPEFAALFRRFGLDLDEVPPWWTLDPCPAPMRVEGNSPSLAVRYTPYSASRHVPDWFLRRPDRPRVCVTAGITMNAVSSGPVPFTRTVLDALDLPGVELVAAVTPAQRAALGPVRDGVRVVEDGALHALLPTCDAVVHHGGAGTMLTAALHGVPQLALTHLPDQRFYAGHMARTGAGRQLPAQEADPRALRDTVDGLLHEPSWRRAAAGLRRTMLALPTPALTVPVVERLVAAHRSGSHPLARQGASL